MKDDTLGAYNIADLREIARRRLPKGIFEFVDRGAEDEVSLRNNRVLIGRSTLYGTAAAGEPARRARSRYSAKKSTACWRCSAAAALPSSILIFWRLPTL